MPSPNPVAALEIDLWLKQAAGLRAVGNLAGAVQLYQRVLRRSPSHADALREMGSAALETGAFDVASELLAQAVKAAPRSAAALIALARAHAAAGRSAEAITQLRKAQPLAPRDSELFVLLGDAQLDTGDRANALRSFRMALKLAPGHPRAAHMAAALEANNGSAAARNAYAGALFDEYAAYFDSHLVAALGYDAPARMRALIDEVAPERHFDTALDLGCGTGLVAAAMAGKADAMDGIDISERMIEAARAKNLYRRLEAADIDTYLAAPKAAAYDLVLAADVFIYVGRLESVFAGVARALRSPGLFVFSVEHTASDDVEIRSSGRFAQSERYLADLAATHGFGPCANVRIDLRTENGRPIEGRLIALQRA